MSDDGFIAALEITAEAFAEIKARFLATGNGDRVHGESLDMRGIVLRSEKDQEVKCYLVYQGKVVAPADVPVDESQEVTPA